MIKGNTEGVRNSLLERLERLYDMELPRDEFLPETMLTILVRATQELGREMMVYVSRDGAVLEIAIGDAATVSLPERSLRRNPDRLSGIRCIHTHPGGDCRLSDVDVQALRMLRFDAMCAVGVADDRATGICAAFLGELEYGVLSVRGRGPVKPGRIPQQLWLHEIETSETLVNKAVKEAGFQETAERVLLVGIESEESLDELAALTDTAGGMVMERVLQKRLRPDPATVIGSGKAAELGLLCQASSIDLAIFDDELTAAQNRNLEEALGVRVIDRTGLILDIFAKRARTYEGKLQVELAQLKYQLPRLQGLGTALSRLGGGIGTRGPGESKLESDRRHARRRVYELETALKDLTRQRELRRQRRDKQQETVVALVGYTNAGKSTLLNALSGSDVYVEDKLFATLDPVLRRVELPENRSCVMVDTVGFIRKLPHELVEAFKSTLEEAVTADLIVVVSDASSPEYETQRRTVDEVLESLGAAGKPRLEALNKCDKLDIRPHAPGAVAISASTGAGLDELKAEIARRVAALRRRARVLVPYDEGAALAAIHRDGVVESEEYTASGVELVCLMDEAACRRIQKLMKHGTIEFS